MGLRALPQLKATCPLGLLRVAFRQSCWPALYSGSLRLWFWPVCTLWCGHVGLCVEALPWQRRRPHLSPAPLPTVKFFNAFLGDAWLTLQMLGRLCVRCRQGQVVVIGVLRFPIPVSRGLP